MNRSTKVALVIVLVVIVSSIIYLQLEIENLSPKQNRPQTPTSTATVPATSIAVKYLEIKRENVGNNTDVTLTVNATYLGGSEINLNYSQFFLQLTVPRMAMQLPQGTTYPLNDGSFILGTNQKTHIFQLSFEFGTYGFNGMDISTTEYYLSFNGTASVQWIPWYQ